MPGKKNKADIFKHETTVVLVWCYRENFMFAEPRKTKLQILFALQCESWLVGSTADVWHKSCSVEATDLKLSHLCFSFLVEKLPVSSSNSLPFFTSLSEHLLLNSLTRQCWKRGRHQGCVAKSEKSQLDWKAGRKVFWEDGGIAAF